MVHQGYTHIPGSPKTREGFSPQLLEPNVFEAADAKGWLGHLKEYGYAALDLSRTVSKAALREALDLLTRDVRTMTKNANLQLDAVTDAHLPKHENSGLRHRGLPHGEFAWLLRAKVWDAKVWQRLYPREALAGCPAVVALSPPGSGKNPNHLPYSQGEWLHLDYSPPRGSNRQMYQSTVHLFPDTAEPGHKWPRIGVMMSMAPRKWQAEGAAETLLAGAILGNAGKSPAGVRFGHLQKIGEGYGTEGMSVLRPELRPGLTDAEVRELTGGRWTSKEALQRVGLGAKPEGQRVRQLCALGLQTLKRLAHPRAVALICGL
jgi:hypothetical protein